MKIEWLNAECTEAIVTRGWFRKVQAHVIRDNAYWTFAATKRRMPRRFDRELDEAMERDRHARHEWVPVAALPSAHLLERKP